MTTLIDCSRFVSPTRPSADGQTASGCHSDECKRSPRLGDKVIGCGAKGGGAGVVLAFLALTDFHFLVGRLRGEWHHPIGGGILFCMTDVTKILSQIEQGDPNAAERLLPLVYEELRKLAAAQLANEKPGQTLQATALVHDAYIRLVDVDKAQQWKSRGHFFGAAAKAMRRIMVENARRKGRLKHGGAMQRLDLHADCLVTEPTELDLLALNEALDRLAEAEPVKAELVTLRFFGGLTMPEAANVLGVSLATAERYWTFAKSWLFVELADPLREPP